MVSVFRDYKFLFITTAIVSFLPITNINANLNNSKTLCDETESLYVCNDGKKHKFRDKTYHLKVSQDNSPRTTPRAAIFVEKIETVVDASQINVIGDNLDQITAYGAHVTNGAELILTNSNFKNTLGFKANNAVIRMTDGTIQGGSRAVYASGEKADIALVNVNIEIEPDSLKLNEIELNDLAVKGSGFVSELNAYVRISGSTITFKKESLFSTRFGGRYLLDTTNIQGSGKKYTTVVDERNVDKFSEAFDISQGGDVHLRDSSVQLTDMNGFLIKNSSGYAYNNGKLIHQYGLSDELKKTNIKIEKSDISVQGKGTNGFYFYGLDLIRWADELNLDDDKRSETEKFLFGEASVYLSETTVHVPDGIAIYSTGDDGYGAEATIELVKTTISSDLLLNAEHNSSLLVKANNSMLRGGIRVEDISSVHLELMHGSSWHLIKRKHVDLQEAFPVDSSLSSIELSDSTLVFEKLISKDYQTLYIGKVYIREGNDLNGIMLLDKVQYDKEAYKAEGNVQIKMSMFVNKDGSFDPQRTDRILIYGNAHGTSVIRIENFLKDSNNEVSKKGDDSISLIQVSGKAKEDSFKLNSNYAIINGLPYQYQLRGYGPDSSRGKADSKNRLVAGSGDFWDFRLESVYIDSKSDSPESRVTPISSLDPKLLPSSPETETISSGPSTGTILPIDSSPSSSEQSPSIDSVSVPSTPSLPETSISTDLPSSSSSETNSSSILSDPVSPSPTDSVAVKPDMKSNPRIRAVVPQLPTYLLLPNALFQTGLMDLTTHNKKLEIMRNAFHSSWKDDENSAFFVRGYGGSYHYASNLSAFEYGYGAEFDYTALEAGVLLNEIENVYSRTLFGVLGTYGSFSLHPQDVEHSKKSSFDKWSVAAYGSFQHDTGFYMDGVFSYGLFRGDVLTLARGKVVALKGKQFSGSFTSGKTFSIGYKGVVFDPQVQVVYQHLQFHQAYDVDNLNVDLGKFHQWVGRVGGRLSKTLGVSQEGREVSFYSKLFYLHSFEDKQFVSFKNDFQLGAFGSSLEVGIGFNARLSSKLSLHGDVTYQHRLKKVGFSGASFSAGLRYLF
ncbi:autotransporter outer membrane beta-barrel domain-containing protein [Bartonella tribocorum]|uniref:Autotransporter outer membrane beta-barrel domain-containing protein n=1 Tax=Bartonella tribocorum TaxID=85701 RepID=A0A2M6USW2_9HYPH|nr:autotransporter outer membrane beta-barrel domain-containing protein [Bartonella tribocorum]PIT69279.1 autotransporter outer membrane beta-barrel domain-containing protein [Bartonella tribocorum]